jgi:hypothetical protein
MAPSVEGRDGHLAYSAAMDLLPLAFTSGWTSGINAYATVLILGLLGRFAGVEEIPVRRSWRAFRRWLQPA